MYAPRAKARLRNGSVELALSDCLVEVRLSERQRPEDGKLLNGPPLVHNNNNHNNGTFYRLIVGL